MSVRFPESALEQRRALKSHMPADDMSAGAIMVRAVDMTHREWLALEAERQQMRRAWGAFFRDFDVLLCPVAPLPAFAHMQAGEMWQRRLIVDGQDVAYMDMMFWPGLIGAFHLPATVVPVARSVAGLPIGIQIAGPLFGDRTTLAVAELLETHGCPFVAPNGWAN